MSTTLIDSVYLSAVQRPTLYFLGGREIYADEVYGVDGLLPLLVRLSVKKLDRLFGSTKASGFRFRSDEAALFGEVVDLDPDVPPTACYTNAVMLSAILSTAERCLGLGIDGVVDITRFHDTAATLIASDDAFEDIPWPLYSVLPVQ